MKISALEKVALSIRSLSMDAIQKANSGHPGLPLGAAELAAVLYGEILNHNPADSKWANRDRFVLSAGHGSMLLYSILHLSGYKLSLDDIKSFRQLGSKCPGHPEYGITDGVEATTGPLGQGVSMAVGMAMAETILAAQYNTDEHKIVDHYTYALVGEGCLMEGISSEACSFAGANKLSKLIVFYDQNLITIDGSTSSVFSENVGMRYESYGWQVLTGSMYDMDGIAKLVEQAKKDDRPSFIILKSEIGKGAPSVQGSAKAHGAPIGQEGIILARQNLGIPEDKDFYVAPEAYDYFSEKKSIYAQKESDWNDTFSTWSEKNPELRKMWDSAFADNVSVDITTSTYSVGDKLATRAASGSYLKSLSATYKSLVGGSADLSGPNATTVDSSVTTYSTENRAGRYIHYGIREFAMAAISNGMLLHGGLRPFCATFMIFVDYMRPALRLSALMNLPVIYILTHDSIYVGEDGPTHQPIETVSALRAIPNVQVLRPADAEETIEAWKIAVENKTGPSCLSLTRQNVPVIAKEDPDWKNTIRCGAYIAKKGADTPEVTVLATGSEVSLAIEASALVSGKSIRIVSVLDRELFRKQPKEVREAIIGTPKRIVVAEAGSRMGWEGFATNSDSLFCIDRFGESAPANVVANALGFTAEKLAEMISK